MAKKKKLRAKLAESVIREQNLRRQQDKYYEAITALWKWDGDPAVRTIITEHIPNFKQSYMWHITDSMIKEWYLPQLKDQLVQIPIYTRNRTGLEGRRLTADGDGGPGVDEEVSDSPPSLWT